MPVRLTKEARTAQLLGVAHDIVKRQGTDALTLARLAEQAGVSKPIAYDHFGTRAGLLAALFRSFDERQVEHMRAAMTVGGASLRAAAEVGAAGYLDCLVGPEWEEVSAALLAYEETRDHLRESRDVFVEAYRELFAPFVPLEGEGARAVLAGFVGAAEALARDLHDGAVGHAAAIDALATIMASTLEPLAAHAPVVSTTRKRASPLSMRA